jgi:ABC-type uncharacterized transport system involved in gliding motility auxiliary subunit
MAQRSQIFSSYLLRVAIAVMVLLVGGLLYLRQDASRDRVYSLSKHSRTTVRALKDKVLVKVFASRQLPPEFSNLNRALRDLLEEFQRNSRGKFRYEYARFATNEELLSQASASGIQPYVAHIQENDELVSKEIVLGLVLEGAGKSQPMVLIPGMESRMEYQIMKELNKFDARPLPDLTIFADSLSLMYQYANNRNELATFIYELSQNYNIIYTDLKTAPRFTPVMLCLGVVSDLQRIQLYHLDQYLMQGGQIVMTQDRAYVYSNNYGTAVVETESNLFKLLDHYGIHIHNNLALDRECEIRKGAGLGTQAPYPFIPMIRGNPKLDYTRGFDSIYHFLASEVTLLPGARLKYSPVLQTSDHSNRLLGPVFQVEESINRGLEPGYLNQPPITVAAEFSGQFNSFFTEALTDSTFHASTDKARVILFGDSELPLDFGAGAYVVLNAVDHLLGRKEAIELRSRNLRPSLLSTGVFMERFKINPSDPDRTSAMLKTWFKLGSILGPLALLLLIGAGVAIHRKVRKVEA